MKAFSSWINKLSHTMRSVLEPNPKTLQTNTSLKVYDLHISIPLVTDKKYISIWVEGNQLLITAQERIREDLYNGYVFVENYKFKNMRLSFDLPPNIRIEHLEAYYDMGELHIVGDQCILHPSRQFVRVA